MKYIPAFANIRANTSSRWPLTIAVIAIGALVAVGVGVFIGRGESALLYGMVVTAAIAGILHSPEFGLYLMLASIPVVNYLPDLSFATSLTALFGAITLSSLAARAVVQRQILWRPRNVVYVGIVLFCLAMILSGLFGEELSWTRILTFVQLFVLVYVVDRWFNTPRHLERIMLVWVISLAVVQVVGLVNYDLSVFGRTNRLRSLVDNPNYLAFFSLVGSWFWLYFLAKTKHWGWRLLCLVGLGLSILSIVLTYSRAGLLMLAASLMYLVWTRRGVRGWGFLAIGASLVLVIVVLGLQNVQSVVENVGSAPGMLLDAFTTGSGSGEDAAARGLIWRSGLDTWQRYPLFGVGIGSSRALGAFAVMTADRYIPDIAGHNVFLNVGVETGLFGLAAFLLIFVGGGWNLARIPRSLILPENVWRLRWAWQGAWLVTAGMALSSNVEADKLLWLIIGASIVLSNLSRGVPASA